MNKRQSKKYWFECDNCGKKTQLSKFDYDTFLKYFSFIKCDKDDCFGDGTLAFKVNDLEDWISS